jgi:PAS domain S-box-containing protein
MQRPTLSRPLHLSAPALSPFLVGLAYYAGAKAAFAIGTLTQMFAPFWPPNVVLLSALLLVPERRWWVCVLAAFPAHLAAEWGVAMPVPQLLVAFACNVAVALLSAVALRRILNEPPWLGDLRKASLYLLIAVVLSPGLVAFGGGVEPTFGDGDPSQYWTFWWRWYLSNALGSLTLMPVVLAWFSESPRWLLTVPRRRWIEAIGLTLGLAAACTIAFGTPTEWADRFLPALLYVPVPLLLWAAVRFGAKGASGAIAIVTVLSLWQAMQGHGPFAATAPGESVLALQLFLAVISVPVILLAAIVEQSQRTNIRLAGVLAGISDCHYTLDRKWRFSAVSPKAAAWLGGRSPASMIGRNSWETLTDTVPGASFVRRAMDEGSAVHRELASELHPGKWIDLHVYPSVDGVSVFFRDITKRKVAEEALRLGAKRLQLAQEAAGVGTWEWDIAPQQLYWSPEVYRLYGVDPAVQGPTLYGEWRRVLHPDDRDWVDAEMQAFLNARQPFAIEFRILRGGETCWMLGRGKVIRDASGRPERIIGVNLDITGLKRMEASLRESEERFRAMAETVPDILFTSSPEGGCDYLSPRFHEYTGLTPAAAAGLGWAEALLPNDKIRVLAAWRHARQIGKSFAEECRIRAADGTYRWFVIRWRPIYDAVGRPQKWFGVIADIDELKRGTEELRKLTSQLLGAQDGERRRIARDLHDSTAQNLLGAKLNIDRVLRLAPDISAQAKGALQESQQLIEQSQREIRTVSYLLHPPLLDTVGLPLTLGWYIEGFSKRSSVSVELDVSPELTERRLPAEVETALFRIVQEGLTNVHRHSGSSTARVRLAREREQSTGDILVALEIADDGRGIPIDVENRSLAGFNSGSAAAPALGVGVAGMRERVRQFGGHLDIQSGPRGTRIRAIVPLNEDAGQWRSAI